MDIVLALVAAVFFAFGTVLLQKAGLEDDDGVAEGAGLLLRMARKPVWLAGIAAEALGFVGQAIALSLGRLAVVQPLLVTSVVFALPLGAKFTKQRVRAIDILAALLVVGALIAFLTVADPSGGRDDAPFGHWMAATGVIALLATPMVVASRRLAPAPRAALLGIATGILFALSAALTKAVADKLGNGDGLDLLTNWRLYALIVVGYVSMTLNQMALSTGALAPAVATSMAFDPIGSVVLGTTLLQESLHETPIGVVATVGSLIAALVGMAILARTGDGPRAAKPGAGPEASAELARA